MAKYKGPSCRLCRREGAKLFLKGSRCVTDKCAFTKRSYSPGQHTQGRVKLSNYGLQLREKQKVKRIYGILERQFKRYFRMAERAKGVTGEKLLQFLERRLDNVTFRLCFASSRASARQLVMHGYIWVNGKRVNIPSYLVKKDDIIQVKGKEVRIKNIKEAVELLKDREIPNWMELNKEELKAIVNKLPSRENVGFPIREHLIVELYSK